MADSEPTKNRRSSPPKIDLSGQRFGRLVAQRWIPRPEGKGWHQGTFWECDCDCGNTAVIPACTLRDGHAASCGCLSAENSRYSDLYGGIPDFTGTRVGLLTIVGRYPRFGWLGKCDCGNECGVRTSDLVRYSRGERSRIRHSCGCLGSQYYKKFEPGRCGRTRLWHNYKNNAKNRNLEFTISEETFFELVQRPCHYCGELPGSFLKSRYHPERSGFLYNGLDRIDNGLDRIDNDLGYTVDNVVPCCIICNRAKHGMPYHEFIKWIRRIARFRCVRKHESRSHQNPVDRSLAASEQITLI